MCRQGMHEYYGFFLGGKKIPLSCCPSENVISTRTNKTGLAKQM